MISLLLIAFLRNLGALVIFSIRGLPPLVKRKDDRVVLKNGDQITGEIKRIERGTLLQTWRRIRRFALTGTKLSGWRARTTSRWVLPTALCTRFDQEGAAE